MSIKIYSREGQISVELNGRPLAVTEIELKFDVQRKDPKILFLTYADKDIQQVFTEDQVDWIELYIDGCYSIIGTGIQPTIMYRGKLMTRVQKARFVMNIKNTIGTLGLEITAVFSRGTKHKEKSL